MIKVVGIGPGGTDYILPIALKEIENAKILVGGKRALRYYASENQTVFPITKDIDSVVKFIKKYIDTDVVVMVSGDPGYYSLLDTINKNFPQDKIEVIAGISSLQIAFSRLNLSWHNAKLLSFHGRVPKDDELFYESGKVLGMLTDNVYNSKKIAEVLTDFNWSKNANYIAFENLSYDDEKITKMTLGEAQEHEPISHGVIIVYGEENNNEFGNI